MKLLPCVILVLSLGLSTGLAQTSESAATLQADFEKIADQLPYLSMSAVLYSDPDGVLSQLDHLNVAEQKEMQWRLLQRALDRRFPDSLLLGLLGHENPKVRTLAAAALFDRNDPKFLPALVPLCADPTPTFDGHGKLDQFALRFSGVGPGDREQTVGKCAEKMLQFYLDEAGFAYGVATPGQPGFQEYWQARKDRAYCAGWFDVQLKRACSGTTLITEKGLDRVRAVRAKIDRLPPEDAAWLLLWVRGDMEILPKDAPVRTAFITEPERVEAARRLGPEKLLAMLQYRIPDDDPDLQPRQRSNAHYGAMIRFVLTHATELLRPEDSDALLACDRWEWDYLKHDRSDPFLTTQWAIAAARLNPAQAAPILHAAIERYRGGFYGDQRAAAAVALWQLAGPTELDFLKEWFYREAPNPSESRRAWRVFIEALGREANGREMLFPLIADSRFAQIDWTSLKYLVRAVNRWSPAPLVTDDALEKVRHPMGDGPYGAEQPDAEKRYPKETAELYAHLTEWRSLLQARAAASPDGR